jgi:hypothetical protein
LSDISSAAVECKRAKAVRRLWLRLLLLLLKPCNVLVLLRRPKRVQDKARTSLSCRRDRFVPALPSCHARDGLDEKSTAAARRKMSKAEALVVATRQSLMMAAIGGC